MTALDQPLYGATFPQAISRFFRKYVTFAGRASRSEYWWVQLFLVLVNILIWVPGGVVGAATGERTVSPVTGVASTTPGPAFGIFAALGILFFLATLIPLIAITVRRLHDANLSGALVLLILVPSIGGLIVLILTLLESRPEGARFDLGATQAPPAVTP
jgi:uncharacterized membrane protein YhaH (DUF805 family)